MDRILKPLLKEDRKGVDVLLAEMTRLANVENGLPVDHPHCNCRNCAIARVIVAEAYWRSIVREVEPWTGLEVDHDDKYTLWVCQFCGTGTRQLNNREHAPTCPWVAASL
jgi:hypothetical protein